MVRSEVKSGGAKNIQPKPIKSKKTLLSENKSFRITRSKSKESESVQRMKKDPSQNISTKNTRSKSLPIISPLQISPRQTRSKSGNIEGITINPKLNQRQPQNSLIKTKTQTRISAIQTIRFVKLTDFKVDTILLAKQSYSIPWPAKILRIEKERVFVYFFGDKRSGYVSKKELYDFISSASAIKLKLESKNTPRAFITGISEVEMLMGIRVSSFHCLIEIFYHPITM